jgi:hypothetical protein
MKSDVSITARSFFEQNGFKVIRLDINVMSNGIELINYHMQKDNNQP